MKTKLITIVSVICLLAAIGCTTSLSYMLTPVPKDQKAVDYVVEAGVADPNEYAGFFNLVKAEKLMRDVDITHRLKMQELEHLMDTEVTKHSIYADVAEKNFNLGVQREEALFGPKGIISMGLTLAGVGGAGILGLMRKRPRDITPEEMQNALAEATGRKQEELGEKEKQFTQLVKGVQTFIDKQKNGDNNIEQTLANLRKAAYASGNDEAVKAIEEISGYADTWNGDAILSLKEAMDKYQDSNTKVEVQRVKKELV